jgi:acetyl esterase/lipase
MKGLPAPTSPQLRSAATKGRARVTRGLVVLLLVLAGVLWSGPLAAHARAVLLISQVLPQIPVKPLYLLTNAPVHTRLTLASPYGPIVADLFRPVPRFGGIGAHTEPAILLVMGVKAQESDKKLLLSFAQTVSRLGYVVMWARLRALDQGLSLPEKPETVIVGVRYLKGLTMVAPRRISIVGISVGGSLAFVAATDPRIRAGVHALIFFGGYYDIDDYLVSLATHTSTYHGKTMAWRPDPQAVGYARKLLQTAHAWNIVRIFGVHTRAQAEAILRAAPARELAPLRALSPSLHLKEFRTPIFILHAQGDTFVPYLQSAKLEQVLPPRMVKTYLISDLFAHTHPKAIVSLDALQGALKLYGFLYDGLSYL